MADGRSHVGLVPVRYPALTDYADQDDTLNLAHRTEWSALSDDIYQGFGQKMFMSDETDFSLLEIANIHFNLGE